MPMFLYSTAEGMNTKLSMDVLVTSEGRCEWTIPSVYASPCPIDVTRFPFDEQSCFLSFSSWIYNVFQLDLQLTQESVDPQESVNLDDYIESGEWSVLGKLTR